MTATTYYGHASRPSYSDMLGNENGDGTSHQRAIIELPAMPQISPPTISTTQTHSHSAPPARSMYPPPSAHQYATCQPQPVYRAYSPPNPSKPLPTSPVPTYQPAPAPTPIASFSHQIAPWQAQSGHTSSPVYSHLQYHSASSLSTPQSQSLPPTHAKLLTECPSSKGPEGILFATDWYRFRSTPDFMICIHCYHTKLSRTPFTSEFEKFHHDPRLNGEGICDFNNERVDRLLQTALRANDIRELFTFAQRRAALGACPGSAEPITAGCGIRWFGIVEIPEFTCCEACYEDFVVNAPFAAHLGPHQLQHRFDAGEAWFCNMAEHFIRRTFVECMGSNDWSAFVGWTRHRMSIADCEGMKDVDVDSRRWYKPSGINGMRICEACYLDYAGNTAVRDSFEEVSNKWYQSPKVRCDFAQISVQLCSAALIEKDFQRWHLLMQRMMTAPECANSVEDGEFYTLTNPQTGAQTDFGICERCFIGYVESSGRTSGNTAGRGGLWTRTRFPGLARCDLNPAAARFKKFVAKYAEMVFTGNQSVLVDFVIKMEGIVSCPGSTIVDDHNRLWWGMDDFFFCEECFKEVGEGTHFASSFRWQGHRCGHSKCDMHSENMRRRYLEACRQQSLDEFTQYCRHRNDVWKQQQTIKTSQQMANRHNMMMGMSQLVAAGNAKHNAAMWGINSVGSGYNSWYDSNYQQAQWQSTQAWNKISGAAVGSAVAGSNSGAGWAEVE